MEQLIASNALPSSQACTTLVEACVSNDRFEDARSVLYHMSLNGKRLKAPESSSTDSNAATSTPIKHGLMHDVPALDYATHKFRAKVYRYFAQGRPDKLAQWVQHVEDAGVAVDYKSHLIVVQCYCQQRDVTSARAIIRQCIDRGEQVQADMYQPVLQALCDTHQLDRAYQLLKHDMVHEAALPPDRHSYTIVVRYLIDNRKLEQARALVATMFQLGIDAQPAEYRWLVNAYCEALRSDQAFEVLREMHDRGHSIDENLCKQLINALALAGDVRSIHMLFDQYVCEASALFAEHLRQYVAQTHALVMPQR
jgi:pentatricopeptide repeat protein